MFRVARFVVVRADIDAPTCDDRRRMRLRTELSRPPDVFARPRIKGTCQVRFTRDHIARPRLAPLWLVGSARGRACQNERRSQHSDRSSDEKLRLKVI